MYKYVDSMGLDGIIVRHIIFSLGDAVTHLSPMLKIILVLNASSIWSGWLKATVLNRGTKIQ
jgi:hypothetical protein